MPDAISNTSPLLYLYRIGMLGWLPQLFSSVWVPDAVVAELHEGKQRGYQVPVPSDYPWLRIVNPQYMPSEWFALHLGHGEIAAMALALENPNHIVILDDALARRTAQAADLQVWGTLRLLLEAKSSKLTPEIALHLDALKSAGMWISSDIRQRILNLADE